MPIQPASAMADRLQQEYDRLRMRHETRAEFLHTQDIHEQLDYYEKRKQRNQLDRYRRAVWSATREVNSSPLEPFIFNGVNYLRLNSTFIIHSDNHDMINTFTNNLSADDLSRGEATIHARYMHNYTNPECMAHSHWTLIASFADGDVFHIRCAACGIGGDVPINSRANI